MCKWHGSTFGFSGVTYLSCVPAHDSLKSMLNCYASLSFFIHVGILCLHTCPRTCTNTPLGPTSPSFFIFLSISQSTHFQPSSTPSSTLHFTFSPLLLLLFHLAFSSFFLSLIWCQMQTLLHPFVERL